MNNAATNTRIADRVLDHHMKAFASGDVDAVLEDYTEDSILMEPRVTHKGLAALRAFFSGLFADTFEPGSYDFMMERAAVEGDVVYIVWRADGRNADIPLGTDTFVIRGGRIVVQTFAGKIEAT